MNFKPAICPSCGGKMQIPEDLKTVKCMYCGIEVIVQKATQFSGRVKEFTQASPIEKVTEWKPYDFEKDKQQTFIMLFILGILGLLISFCVGSSDIAFGIIMAIVFLAFLPIIYVIRTNNFKKIQKADEEVRQRKPSVTLIGFEGLCPYCESEIKLNSGSSKLETVQGVNCPICQKRIIIRDSKFYSVDTPISSLIND